MAALRSLNMSGNPLCQEEGYETHVIAYVPQLRYLDYRRISAENVRHCDACMSDAPSATPRERSSWTSWRSWRPRCGSACIDTTHPAQEEELARVKAAEDEVVLKEQRFKVWHGGCVVSVDVCRTHACPA